MTVTFGIQNVTSEYVHTVMLRKFFQMVFIGEDKKSLHIYTATILGAQKDKLDCNLVQCAGEQFPEKNLNFVSALDEARAFRMKFEFGVLNSDDNEILSIEHEDLTSIETNGFLNEEECIRNVWGENCRVIVNDQENLLKKYQIICPDSKNAEDATAKLAEYKVLWTDQRKSGMDDRYFRSLSVAGKFESMEEPRKRGERDEVAMCKSYIISVPKEICLPRGIELVNWIRTTIRFKYILDDVDHNFIIKKIVSDDKGVNDHSICTFISPDFTWYFSPTVKSYIDNRNCIVEVKRGTKGAFESCLCPLQKNKRIFYRNDKFQNSINPVPNKLTVNFKYWRDEEKINYRQKYRLAARDIFPQPGDFDEVSEISIFLDASDEHNRGNRQFVAGIFLSLALAYGIDTSRLESVSYCFTPLNRVMPPDICWIIFLVLFSFTLMNKPVKLSEASRKMLKIRRIILIVSAVWVACVFGVLRSPMLKTVIKQYQGSLGCLAGVMLLIIGVAHIVYLNSPKVKVGSSLVRDLFGEDLL